MSTKQPARANCGEVEALGLPCRSAADTSGEVARVLTKLEANGARMKLLRVLANSPSGFRPFVLLTTGLLSSDHLPRTVQEVVILRLAVRLGCQYEWEEHVPMAVAAGIDEAIIGAISRGSEEQRLSPEELLAAAFADDVMDLGTVTTDRWNATVETWGTEGALDLLMTVAVWGAMVPTLVGGLGLRYAD